MIAHFKHSGEWWRPRLCFLFFGVALAVNLRLSVTGWDSTLLGEREFREAQTAISTYYYHQDGAWLNYSTPLLGPPWEIPLELPLYEACTAAAAHATGLDLDVVGRMVSWFFFLSALPACYLLLARFGVRPAHRLLFLALFLLSPMYLFFSRSFLIESTALAFSAWFLAGFDRFLLRPKLGWLALATGAGAIAGAVKVTTFAVFLMAAFFLLVAALRTPGNVSRFRLWVRAALGVAAPMAPTLAWLFYSLALRHRNPEAEFLDTHFGFWSFGDLAQRLSLEYWLRTFHVWSQFIIGDAGVLVLVAYFCWPGSRRRPVVLGCLAAFLSGQLIFSNLYFVHDYYFYASGLFLVAAVGFVVNEFLEHPALSAAARAILVTTIASLQVWAYWHTYAIYQGSRPAVPEVVDLVRQICRPDEMVLIVGHDWDGAIPYYAQRRALMFRTGREFDPAGIRRSVARLDPTKIAAVIVQGAFWRDGAFASAAFGALDLGPRPLFFNGLDLGIWVPQSRQPKIRDQLDLARFSSFHIAEEVADGKLKTLLARQIQRRREFTEFNPRPVRATAMNDFSYGEIDFKKVLTANATTELLFRSPAGATRIVGSFGIFDGAYTHDDGYTDGVEFVISEKKPDGTEAVLFRRFLSPRGVAADRGLQTLDVPLPPGPSRDLYFRTLPGPSGNASFDWSYWGPLTIR